MVTKRVEVKIPDDGGEDVDEDDDVEEDGGDDEDDNEVEEEGYQGVGTRIVVRSQTAIESKTQFVGDCIPGLMMTMMMKITMIITRTMMIFNMIYS